MNISVLSPEKEIYQGTVTSVTVPGVEGSFQILNNHAALVGALVEGSVVIHRADGKLITMRIRRGFVEVLHNEIALLVQGPSEINLGRQEGI